MPRHPPLRRVADAAAGGIRVHGEEADGAGLLDVGGIDGGVGADEAMLGLADHDAMALAHDGLRLLEDDLDLARVLLPLGGVGLGEG